MANRDDVPPHTHTHANENDVREALSLSEVLTSGERVQALTRFAQETRADRGNGPVPTEDSLKARVQHCAHLMRLASQACAAEGHGIAGRELKAMADELEASVPKRLQEICRKSRAFFDDLERRLLG